MDSESEEASSENHPGTTGGRDTELPGDHEAPKGQLSLTGSETVPNGAWTWFTDERAIIDPVPACGPRILVGVVVARSSKEDGDIGVIWYDIGNNERGAYTLHDQLEQDDHDVPALYIRPDGRYLAVYAKHHVDEHTRYRISSSPHDPTDWGPERIFDNEALTTYANVYYLPDDNGGDGRTYCFNRTRNFDPNVIVSSDTGSTWEYGGRVVTYGDDTQRPYPRYASDGDSIHLIVTEEHPHQFENGVYHGYIRDGTLYDSDGNIREPVLDGTSSTPAPNDLTTVFEPRAEFEGAHLTRAWTVDLVVSAGGPVGIIVVRANDSPADHRFLYTRIEDGDWSLHHLAKAGPRLYQRQKDYTGLASLDPTNPSRVFISTPIDPRDDTTLDHHELFAGITQDEGQTWEWTALTPEASADNLRPLVPEWRDDHTAVLWMSGQYETYRSWNTSVVCAIDPVETGATEDHHQN